MEPAGADPFADESSGAVARFAAVQMVSRVGDVKGNLARTLNSLEEAAAAGAGIVVLPELSLTGYAPSTRREALALSQAIPGPATERWTDAARRLGLLVVGGLVESDGDRCFNTAVLVGPDGVVARYRKAHLFEAEREVFDPGDSGFPVADTAVGRVGILVCYDLRFPEAVRTLALAGADVIAVPTAWVSLSGRASDDRGRCIQSYVAMAHASMNRVYLVCAGMVGPFRGGRFLGNSVIVDVSGWPIEGPADADSEQILVAPIDVQAARTKHLTPSNDLLGDRRTDLYATDATVAEPGAGGWMTARVDQLTQAPHPDRARAPQAVRWEALEPLRDHPGVEGRRYDSEGLTIIRYEVQEGASYPLHTHDKEQFFQVVSGTPMATVGDRTLVLRPGDLLHVPAGVPHGATSEKGSSVFLSISPRRPPAGDGSGGAGDGQGGRDGRRD